MYVCVCVRDGWRERQRKSDGEDDGRERKAQIRHRRNLDKRKEREWKHRKIEI